MTLVYTFDSLFDASLPRLSTITIEDVMNWAKEEDKQVNTISQALQSRNEASLEQYKECYRASEVYDQYIEMVRERGLDEALAYELWNELNHKYAQ